MFSISSELSGPIVELFVLALVPRGGASSWLAPSTPCRPIELVLGGGTAWFQIFSESLSRIYRVRGALADFD